jgi:hypothetical protein
MKNEILITFLNTYLTGDGYKLKAEYSTNDADIKVIVAQETSGVKEVFYSDIDHLYNYFNIEIFGDNIEDEYKTANKLGNLIGTTQYVTIDINKNKSETWEIIFKQYTNPRTIQYYDIRRVSYTMTLQCVISKIYETTK